MHFLKVEYKGLKRFLFAGIFCFASGSVYILFNFWQQIITKSHGIKINFNVIFETFKYLFVLSVALHPLLSLRSSENEGIGGQKKKKKVTVLVNIKKRVIVFFTM